MHGFGVAGNDDGLFSSFPQHTHIHVLLGCGHWTGVHRLFYAHVLATIPYLDAILGIEITDTQIYSS